MYVKKYLGMGRESEKIDKYALIGIATSTLRKKSTVMYYFLVCVYIFFSHINIYDQQQMQAFSHKFSRCCV
jgi:hypothetical protein